MFLNTGSFVPFLLIGGLAAVANGGQGGAVPGANGGPNGGGAGCNLCHVLNTGPGFVEFVDAPRRVQPGGIYDFLIRITDPQQAGAGFQISAESLHGHVGTFLIRDPVNTRYAEGLTTFVTHTSDGRLDSIDQWPANGGSYEYEVRWQAPETELQAFTFFAAGNAVDNQDLNAGDRYYTSHRVVSPAIPGDIDGDGDADLLDFAAFQACFGWTEVSTGPCEFADATGDNVVALDDLVPFLAIPTGPTTKVSAGYQLADAAHGGMLYDNWWLDKRLNAPTGNHPLYPPAGRQFGSVTFRCKECHGWDYAGRDGAYASGSHFTGIPGILNPTLDAPAIHRLLREDSLLHPNGHGYAALGLSDEDIWDLVRFVFDAALDTEPLIHRPSKTFFGNTTDGLILYDRHCISCHGEDGRSLNFGDATDPEFVGTVAVSNPWEFLHKARFGHPATSMPAIFRLEPTESAGANLGAFAATLPTE